MNKEEPTSKAKKDTEIETENHFMQKEEGKAGKEKTKGTRKEDLKERLLTKEKEASDNFDRLLRTQAEFENYKKRMEREKTDTIKFCNENIIRDLLPIIDSLEMALKHGENSSPDNPKSLIEGIEIVLNQFTKSLEKFGATSFSSIGEKFDPNRHEAIMQIESADHETNSVLSEFQKGYFLNDRLLRPAKVSVTTSPAKQDTDNEDIMNRDK
ncbi:MAG: nucleotide exchange factor GrpE [Pseudomonadota bacterium]